MLRNLSAFTAIALVVAACSKTTPETKPEPETVGVRMNDKLEAPIAPGDCKEATRRALANPNLAVEKVAVPVTMTPAPIDTKKMPKGVADRNGWYTVHFNVLVDATGKPDMKTFVVDTASNPWLGTNVKANVAKWTFAPAEVAGCKISRTYSLGLTPRGKTAAVATKAKSTAKPAAKTPATTTATTKKPPV